MSFITADGVKIKPGDVYYEVRGNCSYIASCTAGAQPPHYEHSDIRFYNKKAAEEYLEEHKPRYSRAEIRKGLYLIQKMMNNEISIT